MTSEILQKRVLPNWDPTYQQTIQQNSNSMEIFRLVVFQILTEWSLRSFAHATTAELSWHVQKFVVISCPEIE